MHVVFDKIANKNEILPMGMRDTKIAKRRMWLWPVIMSLQMRNKKPPFPLMPERRLASRFY